MITQMHVSASVADFPWAKAYGCTDYRDSLEPCLFIGAYRPEDISAILNHKGLAVVAWCGDDSVKMTDWFIFNRPNIEHVSFMPNVAKLVNLFVPCRLFNYPDFQMNLKPAKKFGHKVFIYLPQNHPTYHGKELFEEVKNLLGWGDDWFVIGDGSVPQDEWRSGKCVEYYKQCYVGLVLSRFAGGGSTIVELGLMGIHCVTNVLNLPNTHHYPNDDAAAKIAEAITKLFTPQLKPDEQLSELMLQHLDTNRMILNLDNYA